MSGAASWLPWSASSVTSISPRKPPRRPSPIAAERWPRDGIPQHPVAWLVATGRNRAIDRMRRERTLEESVGCSRTIG